MPGHIVFACLLSVCLAQQTAVLTGGFNGYEGSRAGCELLNRACTVPALTAVSNSTGGSGRPDREDHITAITEDGVLLACGGEAGEGTDDLSCVGLDVAAATWSFHSVLSWPRLKATDVTVPGVGLFVIGGFKQLTTELLPVGGDTWQSGPTLPGTEETDYYGICSVLLSSNTEFMVIGGNGDGIFGATRVQVAIPYFFPWVIDLFLYCRFTMWRLRSGPGGLTSRSHGGATPAPGWRTWWWWGAASPPPSPS